MYAIISDLHSNLEALTAVMEDIRSQGIGEIVCLGDVVGYGPDPEACVDIVQRDCRFCLSGNHDYAVLTRPERFNPLATEAVEYTRRRMLPNGARGGWRKMLGFNRARLEHRWRFLEEQLPDKRELDFHYVHGSPRDNRNEYILETDVTFGNTEKIRDIFGMIPRVCFVGHSHVPGIVTDDFEFLSPADLEDELTFEDGRKYIVNVGSVGQPRDADNRACYATVDGQTLRYRRVEYDYKATMRKMKAVGPLSEQLADRLEQGR